MLKYIDEVIKNCKEHNPGEFEFHQTLEEVLTSLEPLIKEHPEYEAAGLLERVLHSEYRGWMMPVK